MDEPLAPGTVLRDRYRIETLVGQGGMGAVYKAGDLRLPGRVCAVKEAMPALWGPARPESRAQARAQCRREATVLARLDHPNLPKVSDAFAHGPREYLIMDFVAGLNLGEVLRHQQKGQQAQGLPEAAVLAWSAQILDALAYLHGQAPPILHRDVKPANIIVTDSGALKLVDFGLVKVLQPEDQQTITVVQGRGTLPYTPLEQFGGDAGFADAASDLYSFGATLYHLLAGQPPPSAKERFLAAGQLAELRRPGRAISRRTEAAVFHAMAMHPSQRPASAAALRRELLGAPPSGPAVLGVASAPDVTWGEALAARPALLAAATLLALGALGLSVWHSLGG